jgi:SAM-dependent methyltransferase
MDIAAIQEGAAQFAPLLERAKRESAPDGFPWYPYSTLANLDWLQLLLTGDNRRLFDLAPSGIVADVGAADGDLAFYLESLGMTVDIVDYGPTNFNTLRGARALALHLGSSVQIHEVDLDAQFILPRADYDLVFFLGILYHLKNPYYALETLARTARHVVVSTRIASHAGVSEVVIQDLPVAYLLAPSEANNDATNFWIFSATGLRRLFDRCGWDVLDWVQVGDTVNSNPSDNARDERVFGLLRSRLRV